MKLTKNGIANIFWTLAVVAYSFQCFYRRLSSLIIPFLAIFILLKIKKIDLKKVKGWVILYVIYFVFLLLSLCMSSFSIDKDLSVAIRFFLILTVIPIAELINEKNFIREWNSFKIILSLKAAIIIYMWIVVLAQKSYSVYRNWALTTGVGDVYIANGFPRIQLMGNSLFVLAFLVDVYINKKVTAFAVWMGLAAIAAGNQAYLLGIVVGIFFLIYPIVMREIRGKNWKVIWVIPIVALLCLGAIYYGLAIWKGKASYSNVVRYDQAKVLLDANPIFGDGLGKLVHASTTYRVYNGDVYFELQTLYIFHQIGVLGLVLFYTLTFSPYLKNRKKCCLYITYLIYTFWNPYCFDTTHMMAVIIISNVDYLQEQNFNRVRLCIRMTKGRIDKKHIR